MLSTISPTSWLEIDLDAIAHNIAVIRQRLRPETRLMLVVKADAYGHGMTEIITKAASCGCDAFAIISLEEGINIRRAGVAETILLLGTPELSTTFCETLLAERLEPTVSSEEEVRFLENFCATQNVLLPVHLKIDTGMSRLGVWWQQAVSLARTISESSHLRLASVYSHLAGYDDANIDRQVVRFRQTLEVIRAEGIPVPVVHLTNSAVTFARPDIHFDQVRVGLALYGISTTGEESLRPVMSLRTKIVHIKTVLPGEGVGYFSQWTAPKETKIGVMGVGYANGLLRTLSGKMNVMIAGQLASQIGSITMNHVMVDLSAVSNTAVGDIVTIIGKDGEAQISVNELAEAADTIPWEMLCLLGNSNQKTFH